MKSTRCLMGLVAVMSLMLFLHADVVDAASVAITEATVSYGGSNQVVPGDLSSISNDAVLVSFVAENVTYSDLVLVDSVSTNEPQSAETYQYGINGTDPESPTNAVTDNRLDSGIYNAKTTAEFEFASPPTSLSDLFFLFDVGSLDTTVSIQLINGSDADIGAAVQMANMAQLGSAVREASAGTHNLNGVAIPLSDFVTAGDLSSVDGFKIDFASVDLLIAGIASQPELLAYESFEPADVGIFESGNKGDLTWALYGGAIVDTNLTHSGGTVLADGGDRALFVAGPAADNNAFAAFAFAQQTNDVYFSFLASTTSGVFFQPYVSHSGNDEKNSASAVLDTRGLSGDGDLVHARLTAASANTGSGDIGGSQDVNAFIVGKLSKSAAGNYDTLEMLVNPTSLVEPATWATDISRDIGISYVRVFGIRIYDFNDSEGAWIDEVRIGTTFAAVVPPAPKGTVVSIR